MKGEYFVNACSSELIQVFHGIILNAVEAALLVAKPAIDISVNSIGKHVSVRIADNGPGVPEQYKESIFQPFFTTKDVGAGVGLGLSSAIGIIASRGGKVVWTQSTDFVYRELPLACSSAS